MQETRLWDADRGYTRSMRSKEYAHDYRYFPEPDLVPLELNQRFIDEIRASLPELPRARRQRFVTEYGLPPYDADVLTQTRALAEYHEQAATALKQAAPSLTLSQAAKSTSNWIMSELLRVLPADDEAAIRDAKVTPSRLAGLLTLIEGGTISGKIAKDVFEKMFRTGDDAAAIVQREGLTQVVDAGALERIVDDVLAANPKPVDDYKKGKKAAKGALIGLVMRATQNKANPDLLNKLLEEKLSKG